jgi:hypothetical protein
MNRGIGNKIRERIKWYQGEIEYCEEHRLYGKMLHYPAIVEELKALITKQKEGNQA